MRETKRNLYWSFCVTLLAETTGFQFGPSNFVRICEDATMHFSFLINILDPNIVDG
jgi:hypothetical protein